MTKPRPALLAYVSPRRKCATCEREWCQSMRLPEQKEVGCTLWRRKGAEDE